MRLIDADEACKGCVRYGTDLSCEDCVVKSAPTVDAVPVVRCEDCKWCRERNSYEKEYLVEGVVICTNSDVHDDAWGAMYGDDFCSRGERKDGDE